MEALLTLQKRRIKQQRNLSNTESNLFFLASCFILFQSAIAQDSIPAWNCTFANESCGIIPDADDGDWNCTSTNESCAIIPDADNDRGIQRNTSLLQVLLPIIAILVIAVVIVVLTLKFCKRNRMTSVIRRMPATRRRRHPDPANSTGLYTLQQSEAGETDLYVYTVSTCTQSCISTLGYSTNKTSATDRSSFGTEKYDYVDHVAGDDSGKLSNATSKIKNNVSDCPAVSVKKLSRLFESNHECHVTHKVAELELRHVKRNLPHVTDQAVRHESRHFVNTSELRHVTDPADEENAGNIDLPPTSPRDDAPVYATEISKVQVSPQEDLNLYDYAASTDSQVFSLGRSTDNTSTTSRLSFGTDKYIYIEVDEGVEVSNTNTKLKDDVSDCPSVNVKYLSHHFESMEGNLNHVTDPAAECELTCHVTSAEKLINNDHYDNLASLSDEKVYDVLSHNKKMK